MSDRRRVRTVVLRVAGWVLPAVAAELWLERVAGAWPAAVVAVVTLGIAGVLWARVAGPDAARPDSVAVPEPALAPVRSLSRHELGWEWLRTAAALGAALEPGTRQHVADRRRELLDEMERRDPAAIALWLADGAPEGTDPSSYLPPGPPAGNAGPQESPPGH